MFFGNTKVTISNTALGAIMQHAEIELNEVNEPQIAGVTDEDIKDESQPVTFEEVNDEDVIDKTPSEPVTIDAESSYVNQ